MKILFSILRFTFELIKTCKYSIQIWRLVSGSEHLKISEVENSIQIIVVVGISFIGVSGSPVMTILSTLLVILVQVKVIVGWYISIVSQRVR